MLTAFATARRALVSRRSSTGSSPPPASIDSRSRTMARSANSSAMPSSRLRMSSNSPAIERLVYQIHGMADVQPRRGEEERATGVGRRHDGSTRPSNRVQLSFPDAAGQIGMQRAVGAARAAAESLVVQWDDVGVAAEDGVDGEVRLLHMAEMARVVDRDGEGQ